MGVLHLLFVVDLLHFQLGRRRVPRSDWLRGRFEVEVDGFLVGRRLAILAREVDRGGLSVAS